MNLADLIKDSNESKLINFIANPKEITLFIYHDHLDKKFELKFPYSNYYNSFSIKSNGICYLSYDAISSALDITNGVYIPSKDFPIFMREVKSGLNVLYGLRESQYKFFFSCNGSFNFIIPIECEKSIKIREI